MDVLIDEVSQRLEADGALEDRLRAALDLVLARFDCAVGTIHALEPISGRLELQVERGIPAIIRERVLSIPIGKGMAGIAAERRAPVQVCNLQTDDSGVAKPGARETEMEGSLALPILVDGELRGTLGVAKPTVYEFTPGEIARLQEVARVLGRHLD